MSLSPPVLDPSTIATREELSRALTDLRERAGLTVRDVARQIDVPVATVGGWFSGHHVPPIVVTGQVRALLHACGVRDPEIPSWLEAVSRVRRKPGRRPSSAPIPYRGLAAFQPGDAAWFFGREQLTAVLVERVRQSPATPIVVVGPSGAGKSSLLRAGLVPALTDPDGPGESTGGAWAVALTTPGPRPLDSLAEALAQVEAGAARTAVVVDQLEEVFTAGADDGERAAFVSRLDELAAGGTPIVLGLRADFYSAALRMPQLLRAIQATQVVVGAMTAEELRRALVEPARLAGIDVEDALVDVVMADLAPARGSAYDAGALPLFAHALYETWERGSRRRLTVADYRAAGGIHGAIATTAERVFTSLGPEDQERARTLFLRLVHVGEDVADTRRRVEPALVEAPGYAELLERFVGARLITADDDAIQLAHEALISAWPRLRAWIDSDRAGLVRQRELADAATAWQRAGQDPGMLLRSGRLATATEWATDPRRAGSLSDAEHAFLAASIEASESERRAEAARTRRLRALVAALTALVVVVAGVSGYAFNLRAVAAEERDLALSRQLAEAANRVRESDPSIAAQFALLAYRTAETTEARSALLDSSALPLATRVQGPGGLAYVAVSGEGSVLASVGDAGGLRLWTISDAAEPVLTETATIPEVDGSALYAVALSPDATLLAAAGAGEVVHLWDISEVSAPRLVADLAGPTWSVMSLAFSPDGRTLAAASADTFLYLWDVSMEPVPLGEPLAGAADELRAVAFSPDGAVVAAGGADGTVRRWMTGAGHTVLPNLEGAAGTITSVAFRPDGTGLVAGSKDSKVYSWELGTPAGAPSEPVVADDAGSWVNAVAVSPDGAILAAASSDRHVRLYDAESGSLISDSPHPGPVTGVVFLPDGRGAVTGAADGVVRLWPAPTPAAPAPGGRVFSVAIGTEGTLYAGSSGAAAALTVDISEPYRPVPLGAAQAPDGGALDGTLAFAESTQVVAAGGRDGTVWLWDASGPELDLLATAPKTQTELIEGVAFSRDGTILAAASDDGTVQLWDVTDPERPAVLGTIRTPGGLALFASFSPDGRTLAVGNASPDVITLWDISDAAAPTQRGEAVTGPAGNVYAIAHNPAGTILAVGATDTTVRLLDVSAEPAWIGEPLLGASGPIYSAAFSADGTRLAAASGDGVLRIWDVTAPAAPTLVAALGGATAGLYSVGFDPSGDRVAAGGINPTVPIWDLDPETVAGRVCALAGMGVSEQEWRRYLPSVPYTDPCTVR